MTSCSKSNAYRAWLACGVVVLEVAFLAGLPKCYQGNKNLVPKTCQQSSLCKRILQCVPHELLCMLEPCCSLCFPCPRRVATRYMLLYSSSVDCSCILKSQSEINCDLSSWCPRCTDYSTCHPDHKKNPKEMMSLVCSNSEVLACREPKAPSAHENPLQDLVNVVATASASARGTNKGAHRYAAPLQSDQVDEGVVLCCSSPLPADALVTASQTPAPSPPAPQPSACDV
jgi:hypothetical protein